VTRLRSGRVELALHELASGAGPTLLCLHALYGAGSDFRDLAAAWPGRVLALDFPGHGRSPRSFGGSYTPENLVENADVALAHAGEAQLVGAGLGAYVALLLAGARPDRIGGALLLPGPGLAGGGPEPNRAEPEGMSRARFDVLLQGISADANPDPMLENCDRDIRPPDYARAHADAARLLLLAEGDDERPPWWHAAREADCAEAIPADPKAALTRLAGS